jgi:6,7-dimethyl-8-ribityllumazine synthase
MHIQRQTELDASGMRLGLIVSRYHEEITSALRNAAVEAFTNAGGSEDDLLIVASPGAFELPMLAAGLLDRKDIDGVAALGCVVRGETSHDQHIASAVSQGLMQLALKTGKPAAFGVITCSTLAQAKARSGGGHGNKGEEAVHAVVETVAALRAIREQA